MSTLASSVPRPSCLMKSEINGVVQAGVGKREVVAVDAVIDTTSVGEGQAHD